MYVCMYACMNVCMHVFMYACVYACMYVCRYVCMYVCTYNETIRVQEACKRQPQMAKADQAPTTQSDTSCYRELCESDTVINDGCTHQNAWTNDFQSTAARPTTHITVVLVHNPSLHDLLDDPHQPQHPLANASESIPRNVKHRFASKICLHQNRM